MSEASDAAIANAALCGSEYVSDETVRHLRECAKRLEAETGEPVAVVSVVMPQARADELESLLASYREEPHTA